MTFTPAFLDELRARLPLADLVGRRVRLIKRGREYVALCPFHNEKTPSFTLSEDKGFFHCFGCEAHGDVIGFVMRSDNLSFPEAVERLAGEAGLEVPRATPEERAKEERAKTLHEVVEAACAWFEARLGDKRGEKARAYLERRGVDAASVKAFRLGYAPDSRDALKSGLAARGIDEEPMVEAGLLIVPDDGGASFDRFRERLIFPIADRRGRVIAFGGRTLGEAKAKYLNSPETPLFHKGRVLYNLARARPEARKAGTVLVAEGYMDVIALDMAGFTHAVAPLGTALSEAQIQELWRLAPEPVLCLDGDSAGRRAAYRAAERCLPLLKPGHSLRFAMLPPGEDPDSLIARQGPEAMAKAVEAATPLSMLLWQRETLGHTFSTPERRAGLRQRVRGLANLIGEPSVRDYYLKEFDARLQAMVPAARRDWGGRPAFRPGRGLSDATGRMRSPEALDRRREQVLLLVPLNHPELIPDLVEDLAAEEFAAADLDMLRQAVIEIAGSGTSLDSETLQLHLKERGFSEIVDELNSRELIVLAQFARPEATAGKALSGWYQALTRHRRSAIEAQLRAAEMDFATDMTPETEARLFGLQRALAENSGDEADLSVEQASGGHVADSR